MGEETDVVFAIRKGVKNSNMRYYMRKQIVMRPYGAT